MIKTNKETNKKQLAQYSLCARHGFKHFMNVNSLNHQNDPICVVIIPILQMRKLKFRKFGKLPKSHGKWNNRDVSPGDLTPELSL